MLETDPRSCPFQEGGCKHGECALWITNAQNATIGDCAFARIAAELTKANDPTKRAKY